MRVLKLHSWQVTPKEAMGIQEQLRRRIVVGDGPDVGEVRRLGAADVSYDKKTRRVYATVLVFSFPDLTLLEQKETVQPATFPYVPGLLTFREGPALVKAFEEITEEPDVIMFDGQGIAHPRGIGIASHMGLLLDKPGIGCAKTVLVGDFRNPAKGAGSTSPLVKEGVELGVALRTRTQVRPIFVSVGHKIDLARATRIVLASTRGYRSPEPIRLAHIASNKLRLTPRSDSA